MKKLVPLGMIAAILLVALAVSAPADANAQSAGLVSSLLNRMERNRKSLTSLRASIDMEKYNAQIKDSDKYKGTVLYVPSAERDAYVRLEWQRPQHEILTVAKGAYTLFRPRLNMAYQGNARSASVRSKGGSAFEMMNMSRQQLMARYEPMQDLYEETLWGGVHTTHFKLVPKSGAGYKYMEVWVDDGGLPVQTKVVERNDDSTTVRLTNIDKNDPIPMEQFTIKLDKGVQIVRG